LTATANVSPPSNPASPVIVVPEIVSRLPRCAGELMVIAALVRSLNPVALDWPAAALAPRLLTPRTWYVQETPCPQVCTIDVPVPVPVEVQAPYVVPPFVDARYS
jgi:hypothetical protein